MFTKLRNKIEERRKKKDIFSRGLITLKDFLWKTKIFLSFLFSEEPISNKIEAVNFAVTYKCNSRCKNCNIWKKYHEHPEKVNQELTLNEIKKIFSSKYLKDLKRIQFTGGEPFLRDDFVDLFSFFIKKYPNIHIGMPTNSVDPKLILKKLNKIVKKCKPKSFDLCISLDGIGKIHDNVRGLKGDYKRTIKMLDEIKKRFPFINISIGFTINSENYKDLLKVYEFSKERNIDFGFWFGQVSKCFYDNLEKERKEFNFDERQLREIDKMVNFIIKDMKKRNKLDFFGEYYFLNMVHFKRNPKRKINCYSGIHSFFLDPYGNIYPCIMLNKKFGNAKEGFDNVWSSNEANKIRNFIKKRECSCWTSCETYPSLVKNKSLILKNLFRKANLR